LQKKQNKMAILKFILIVTLLYYLAKSLVKLLFPFLLKNLNNKMNSANNNNFNNKNEGDISIKYSKKNKKIDKNIGEYTDFEEIDDN